MTLAKQTSPLITDNLSRDIKWIWVRAHQSCDSNESIYNNMADKLATGAIIK